MGVDLGLVQLESMTSPAVQHTLPLLDPRAVGIHHRCRWTGGRSGVHRGFVVANCNVYNDPAEPYFRSYYLNGDLKKFAGMEGDSGSIVTDEGGAALGHFIGVDGYSERGLYQSAWVQDAHTALAYASEKLGQIHAVVTLA